MTRKQVEDRRERIAQIRATDQRLGRRRAVLIRVVVVVAVIAIAGLAAVTLARNARDAEVQGVQTFGSLARDHVSGQVRYPQTPPVGGPHGPVLLNCGVYTTPVPNENAVHSMEHGAVWITYRPDLGAEQVARLRQAVRGQLYTILSPYAGLPAPIVLSAWGRQLRVTDAADARIADFISAYQRGPQTPERDAPCAGGVGSPS